jgi:predicted permease
MFPQIFRRLQASFSKRKKDRILDEELQTHLSLLIEQNIARGMTPQAARRAAKLSLGGADQIKESVHDHRGLPLLDTLVQDIRFALRMLRKSPGFTAVAILTLALGIGANTAIFSVMNGVMLRDVPVPHPQELVFFGAHDPGEFDTSSLWLSFPLFREIEHDQTVFSSVFACWCDAGMSVQTGDGVSLGVVSAVTGDFFTTLGARPQLGRLIGPEDVDLKTYVPTYVAVLGYEFWRSHYGGAQDVVGKSVRISGVPFTIIGVTQRGFRGISPDVHEGIIIPLTAEPVITGETDVKKVREHLERADSLWLSAEGRLKPGVTLGRAKAQLESLWPNVRESVRPPKQTPPERANFDALTLAVVSGAHGDSFLRNQFAKPLYVLLAISVLVLLTACANLASLMLARAESRGHETAVRAALGASRSRIVRQILTESLLLSFAGTLAGFVVADYGSQALTKFIIGQTTLFPESVNLSPDWRVLGLAAGAAILTGVLSGFASAWRAAGQDPNEALQQGTRTLSRGTGRLGRGLVAAQVGLSLVLIGFAGLFLRSLEKLYQVQPGFQTHSLLDARLDDLPGGYKNLDMVSYYRELIARVSHLPGVASAGMAHMGLGSGYAWVETVRTDGASSPALSTDFEMVTPGFFRTVGIRLLEGRAPNWDDLGKSPHVALASASLARQLNPRGDVIGTHVEIPSEPEWQPVEIVGIVSNASLYQVRKTNPPTLYVPSMQYGDLMGWSDLYVRTKVQPAATMHREIGALVASFGHEYVLSEGTVGDSINQSLLRERITAMLSAFFGALALLIAAIGLYGLMSYNVTRRTRELGIRLALGAQRGTVLRMILRETLTLTLIGIAVGVPCVFAATGFITHMLFGVTPYDPVTLVTASVVLLATGALAGYIPARRATRVHPMVALRYE